MRIEESPFASGLSFPYISSLHTVTAWRSKRKETTGETKSKYRSFQLCWLQLARAAKPWSPKRKCHLVMVPTSHPSLPACGAISSHMQAGSVEMRGAALSHNLLSWPPILFHHVPSSSMFHPQGLLSCGRTFFPQHCSILCVLLRSLEAGLPKLLIALQACQTGVLD